MENLFNDANRAFGQIVRIFRRSPVSEGWAPSKGSDNLAKGSIGVIEKVFHTSPVTSA